MFHKYCCVCSLNQQQIVTDLRETMLSSFHFYKKIIEWKESNRPNCVLGELKDTTCVKLDLGYLKTLFVLRYPIL